MKRGLPKKNTERRRRKRGSRSDAPGSTGKTSKSQASVALEACHYCGKELQREERALFVEEEVGRIFCTEECITGFFSPEIERLEKEYFRKVSSSDLPASEREKLAHLRWITLQEPDEVWREKTLSGDYRYTLISEFMPGSKPVWSICLCLFLRGEPSFLFLAFVTRNAGMVNYYRRGERVQRSRIAPQTAGERAKKIPGNTGIAGAETPSSDSMMDQAYVPSDRLASEWTEDETYMAQMNQERSEDDIPQEEFQLYHGCLEETLEAPDEVWTFKLGGKQDIRLFHFIRHYPDEKPGVWYLIIAKESDQADQIEILDAFPTRDEGLVNRYRVGEQELGGSAPEVISQSRLVH
jgi:hypothetical protein